MIGINLNESSIFHQQTFKISQDKELVKGFIGVGFMNGKGDISTGEVPFDFIMILLGIKNLKEVLEGMGRRLMMEIFLGDVNAYKQIEDNFQAKIVGVDGARENNQKVELARRSLQNRIVPWVDMLGLAKNIVIVVGSEYVQTEEYKELEKRLVLKPTNRASKYALNQLIIMAKHKQDGYDFRMSWTKDFKGPADRDERFFDILYEEVIGERPVGSVYCKAGRKASGVAVPYSFFGHEEGKRLTLNPEQSVESIKRVLGSKVSLREYYFEMVEKIQPSVKVMEENLAEEIAAFLYSLDHQRKKGLWQ